MKAIVTFCIPLLLAMSGLAEYRTWTDRSGRTFEAEYVRAAGANVSLRGRSGNVRRFETAKLCDEDIRYVQLQNPPRLALDVDLEELEREYDVHVSKSTTGIKRESTSTKPYWCEVTIERKGGGAYDEPLDFHLYWFTSRLLPREEWEDNKVTRAVLVLKHQKSTFYPQQIKRGKAWEWSSKPVRYICTQTLDQYKRWDFDFWDRYYAHLGVVVDTRGEVIAMVSDEPRIKKQCQEIMAAEEGQQLFSVGVRD